MTTGIAPPRTIWRCQVPALPARMDRPRLSHLPDFPQRKVCLPFTPGFLKPGSPADPHLMLRFVSEAIALEAPIRFVLYWGKGTRCNLGIPDIACLDYLAALAGRVRAIYEPGAAIKLIFTDP